METGIEKYHNNNRTEEVQDIIDRMPTRFGFWVSMIVLVIFVLLFVFGWLIRYPDVVTGEITINSNEAPVKLISMGNGKLKLNGRSSMSNVKEGEVVAYIQNAAEPQKIFTLDSLLKTFDPNSKNFKTLIAKLPNQPSYGELNGKYATFISSLNEINNHHIDQLFEKQRQNLDKLLAEQQQAIQTSTKRVNMNSKNLEYMQKFYKRDSILLAKRVISEAELDKTQMGYISNKDAHQGAVGALINSKQQAQQTLGKIKEIEIQKTEKEKELRIAVVSSYNDLLDNIKSWEQKYVFKAPFDGKIQFLKFWTENQFVQNGEPIFTIIPQMKKAMGQVNIPARGAGKIKVGQEVIVKLENYPYTEYGSIKGLVNSISLSTNTVKTDKGDMEQYLVTVDFPQQLRTNYGAQLDVKLDAKGSAEIITNDRKLIERFFDNLKYAVKK